MMKLVSGHNADIGLIPFEEFVESVQFFGLVPSLRYMQEASLVFANKIRLKEPLEDFRDPPRTDLFVFITRDAHAFIAKNIILHSPTEGTHEFKREDYKWLVASFHELVTDLTYLDPKEPDAFKYVIRVENAQFRYWYVYGDIMGRYIIMFDLPDSEEINVMCQRELGLSFSECITICLCMFADMQTRRQLNFKMLTNHTIDNDFVKSCLTEEKIKRFCELFSATIEKFKEENEKYASKDDKYPLQKYEFNPLYSFPMIKTGGDFDNGSSLIIPSMPDLIYASCEGVYYKLMDKFKQDGKKNEFSGKFGKIYESYFYHLLGLANITYFDENDTKENPNKLDALLIDEADRIHIEVKKNKMSVFARAGIGGDLEKFIDRLTDENIYGQLYKKREPNSINLLVCMDELFGFEDKIKPVIEKKLKVKKGFDSSFKFHLVGIRDLEYLIEFHMKTKTSWVTFFKHKEAKGYYRSVGSVIADDFGFEPKEGLTFIQDRYLKFYRSLYSMSSK